MFMKDYVSEFARTHSAPDCLRIVLNIGSIDKRIEGDTDWIARKLPGVNASTRVGAVGESTEKSVELLQIVREKLLLYKALMTLRF